MKRLCWSLFWIALLIAASIDIYRSLPSNHITIYSGPKGGTFYNMAIRYSEELKSDGYEVKVIPSDNTNALIANVEASHEPNSIGFQIGEINQSLYPNVQSLGFVSTQPLFIFYNNAYGSLVNLSTLKGQPLLMPPRDSVTASTALQLLSLYGITEQNTPITFLPFQEAVNRLRENFGYALFLMIGAENPVINELMVDPRLGVFSYSNPSGILKKLKTLRLVTIETASYDVLTQIPPQPLTLLAGQVEIITNKQLDKAASYAILSVLEDVHHTATLTTAVGSYPSYSGLNAGTYPAAENFAKTGTPWIYQRFPASIATLIEKYIIFGLAIFLLTEVYRTLRYLYEFLALSAETAAPNIIRRATIAQQNGRPSRGINRLMRRWAESVINRKSIKQKASEMLSKTNNED